MKDRRKGPFLSYVWAVLIVGVAAALRWELGEILIPFSPFITFYPATVLSALLGGVGPGLLATGLGGLSAAYMFLPPIGSLKIELLNDAVELALFCSGGILISLLTSWLHRMTGAIQD